MLVYLIVLVGLDAGALIENPLRSLLFASLFGLPLGIIMFAMLAYRIPMVMFKRSIVLIVSMVIATILVFRWVELDWRMHWSAEIVAPYLAAVVGSFIARVMARRQQAVANAKKYIDAPSHALIDQDLACVQCGYNLRSMSKGSACPECCTAIESTLDKMIEDRGLKIWPLLPLSLLLSSALTFGYFLVICRFHPLYVLYVLLAEDPIHEPAESPLVMMLFGAGIVGLLTWPLMAWAWPRRPCKRELRNVCIVMALYGVILAAVVWSTSPLGEHFALGPLGGVLFLGWPCVLWAILGLMGLKNRTRPKSA